VAAVEAPKNEPRVKRSRSLDRHFYGLALDENRLAQIATRIKELTEPYFTISVQSADGEENVETQDPESFADSSMPTNLGKVKISGYGSVHVYLALDPKYVLLNVSSENVVQARAVLSEIERELQLCRDGSSWFAQLLHGGGIFLIVSVSNCNSGGGWGLK
jgi:hypothetical protein